MDRCGLGIRIRLLSIVNICEQATVLVVALDV